MSGQTSRSWSDVNALYQVYIRSFQDTTDDGVGDLRGVIERLDYIKGNPESLGVDAILLSPFYESPMVDFGYDVTDHCAVDPRFGTLHDFDELLDEAHRRDIKVMIDIIPNHTSDQHPWFLESESSRDNPKRDWYIWRDPLKGMLPPNNWQSRFGGSVWEYDARTEQYYYHTFFAEQPDLNWENPEVRGVVMGICKFWLDRGVDGLRLDAAIYLSKDVTFEDNPVGGDGTVIERGMSYGEKQAEYLLEFKNVSNQYQNILGLIEAYPEGCHETIMRYHDLVAIEDDHTAPLILEGMWLPFKAKDFREFLNETMLAVGPRKHIPVFCFGNHDNQRLASKFGSEQARAIAIIHLTLPGMPLIYYGEEIGMTDSHKIRANQADGALQAHMPSGRGVARTPMQWNNARHAGFSKGAPWLPVNSNAENNVMSESGDPDSFMSLYSSLLRLRGDTPALRNGNLVLGDTQDDVLVFSRVDGREEYITVVNMSDVAMKYTSDLPVSVVVSSHPADKPYVLGECAVQLKPNEAVVLKKGVST